MMNSSSRLHLRTLVVLLATFFCASLYVFSRFTVDDAFISWRYGRNLIEFGIWAYNPTPLDPTQAYTNPLFAFLSIVPGVLGMDYVLFFKLLSAIFVASLLVVPAYNSKDKLLSIFLVLCLLSLPSTIVHAFSGLETLFYGVALAVTFIALDAKRWKLASVGLTLSLLLRPEAHLLMIVILSFSILLLHPRILYWARLIGIKREDRFPLRLLFAPAVISALLAIFHFHAFGHVLPNTFFAKSDASFSSMVAAELVVFALPISISFLMGRRVVPIVIILFTAPIIIQYASSDLQMNYASRFAYHIFIPIFLYTAWAVSVGGEKNLPAIEPDQPKFAGFSRKSVGISGLVISASFLALSANSPYNAIWLANYYPRALDSHAQLGEVLLSRADAAEPTRYLIGDAGMAPFRARGINLDNVGLASSMVARGDSISEALDAYRPEFIFLHGSPLDGPWRRFSSDEIILWSRAQGYSWHCNIFWDTGYVLMVYADSIPEELSDLCAESYLVNSVSQRDYFFQHVFYPPLSFWHE